MVATLGKKIIKKTGEEPTELENQVAQALVDLESSSNDLKADLHDLYIVSAKEIVVDAAQNKSAIVIFVPFVLHKAVKKIQPRLVRELEKKFSGKHVIFLAQRTIFSKNYSRQMHGARRPRSRTLTHVHEQMLEDVVYPTEIVGKRTRVRVDRTKLFKVYLDPKDRNNIENKIATFAAVYKKLTNRNTQFMFPVKN